MIARASTAISTAAMQARLIVSIQVLPASLPVPKPCSTAIGHAA